MRCLVCYMHVVFREYLVCHEDQSGINSRWFNDSLYRRKKALERYERVMADFPYGPTTWIVDFKTGSCTQ